MARVAIVTGGTRGIGAAISVALRDMGMTVAATYLGRDEDAVAFQRDTSIPVYKWNVADPAECRAGVARIVENHGPVDILINNAGITRDASIARMTDEMWNDVLATNIGGCFNMARVVMPGMRERKFGRIVNIASINGQSGQFGQTNYAAAKAAMFGFTKSLALEGAKAGITVNAIAPGYVDTEMVAAVPADILAGIVAKIPVGRLGTVHDIARGVTFLCADDADFVTGSTLTINGGAYMH